MNIEMPGLIAPSDATQTLAMDDPSRFDPTTPAWLIDVFEGLDGGRPEALTGRMHDDIMFRWGSLPDVHGLDVVKGMFEDLYTKVRKMRHRVFATHVVGDVTFAQGQAAFELFSGEAYYGDYADVFTFRDGKIAMQIVYMDNNALGKALA